MLFPFKIGLLNKYIYCHYNCCRLNVCREVMDGLRVYFDFIVNDLLLYNPEQKQYLTQIPVYQPLKVEIKNE